MQVSIPDRIIAPEQICNHPMFGQSLGSKKPIVITPNLVCAQTDNQGYLVFTKTGVVQPVKCTFSEESSFLKLSNQLYRTHYDPKNGIHASWCDPNTGMFDQKNYPIGKHRLDDCTALDPETKQPVSGVTCERAQRILRFLFVQDGKEEEEKNSCVFVCPDNRWDGFFFCDVRMAENEQKDSTKKVQVLWFCVQLGVLTLETYVVDLRKTKNDRVILENTITKAPQFERKMAPPQVSFALLEWSQFLNNNEVKSSNETVKQSTKPIYHKRVYGFPAADASKAYAWLLLGDENKLVTSIDVGSGTGTILASLVHYAKQFTGRSDLGSAVIGIEPTVYDNEKTPEEEKYRPPGFCESMQKHSPILPLLMSDLFTRDQITISENKVVQLSGDHTMSIIWPYPDGESTYDIDSIRVMRPVRLMLLVGTSLRKCKCPDVDCSIKLDLKVDEHKRLFDKYLSSDTSICAHDGSGFMTPDAGTNALWSELLLPLDSSVDSTVFLPCISPDSCPCGGVAYKTVIRMKTQLMFDDEQYPNFRVLYLLERVDQGKK